MQAVIAVTKSVALAWLLFTGVGCVPFPLERDSPQEGAMDNSRLETLIEGLSDEIEGETGYWSFVVESRQVLVITDEAADRMRIMTPVAEHTEVTAEEARVLLEANFDRALDARYAVARGYLWSVFVHPLSPLTDAQFVDGVEQVVTLADNFKTSYASTDLVFQGGQN